MLLTFFCSDVSGSPLPSIPLNSFTVDFKSGSQQISGYSSSLSNDTSGFYSVTISDSLPLGSYRVSLLNPLVYVSPDFYTFEKTDNYSIDEIYSLVYSNSVSPVILSSSERYATSSFNLIDGDDVYESFVVPSKYLPLTSWTSFTVGAHYFDATSQTYIPITGGSNSVTVTDASLGIIRVIMDNNINVIDYSGAETNKTVIAQVQALDQNGYKRTLLEIQINVSRDYNRL